MIAERVDGGTPWHAHHIAERHSLFVIIALGERIAGTVALLSAIVEQQGWSMETAIVGFTALGITFAMWWLYDLIPSTHALHTDRSRAFVWGYTQTIMAIAIVAVGSGLHTAACYLEGEAHISAMAAILILLYCSGLYVVSVFGRSILADSSVVIIAHAGDHAIGGDDCIHYWPYWCIGRPDAGSCTECDQP